MVILCCGHYLDFWLISPLISGKKIDQSHPHSVLCEAICRLWALYFVMEVPRSLPHPALVHALVLCTIRKHVDDANHGSTVGSSAVSQ